VEAAVVELIKEGERKGIWNYKPISAQQVQEIKDELVQTQAPKTPTPAEDTSAPTPQQSNDRQAPAGVEGKSEAPKEKVVSKKKDEDLKVTDMQTGVKPTITLFGEKVLKENSYLYAKESETSTRTWWVAKGTIMSIKQPGTEGWWSVVTNDGTNRKGWIQSNKLEEQK
jgi:hypothetical protein